MPDNSLDCYPPIVWQCRVCGRFQSFLSPRCPVCECEPPTPQDDLAAARQRIAALEKVLAEVRRILDDGPA